MLMHRFEAVECRYWQTSFFMGPAIAVVAVTAIASALVAARSRQRWRLGGQKPLFAQPAYRIARERAHLN